MDHKDSTKT